MRTRLLAVAAAVPLLLGAPTVAAASAGPATAVSQSSSNPCGTMTSPSAYTHVIWVWMENHSYNTIIGSSQAPYINSLATECGLATNYHNISHPSLPNYVGATSGLGFKAVQKFRSDCNPSKHCSTPAPSIFGQGETWKAYEESMPSNCDPVNSGEYAVRHNPPPYFTTLQGCSTFDVPYTHLAADLAGNNLPVIFNSPEYQNGSTAVFVTWDEGEGGKAKNCTTNTTDVGCQVATIVISPSTVPGTTSATLFNHYSLLGTAEQLLGLPKLGLASSFPTLTSAFNL